MNTRRTVLLAATAIVLAALALIWTWNGYVIAPAVHTDSAVVWAPHPDDETYAMGATIADLTSRGTSVTVVLLTDGEASSYAEWWIEEHGTDLDRDLDVDQWDFALARRIEFRNAARALGVDRLIFLGAADSQGEFGLREGSDSDQFLDAVEDAALRYSLRPQTHLTVARYHEDDRRTSDEHEHKDHTATHDAVGSLSSDQGSEFYALKVYEYQLPLWRRSGIATLLYSGETLAAKRRALDAYGTIGRKSTSELWAAAHTEVREFVADHRERNAAAAGPGGVSD